MATDEQFRRVRRMLKEGADQQAEGAFRMGAVWAARELGHPLDDDLVERGLRWYKLARERTGPSSRGVRAKLATPPE